MVYRLSCGFVMISMEREEIRKLIENYAESKVDSMLNELKDDDNLKDFETEFDEFNWLQKGDRLWLTLRAFDVDERKVTGYYDIERNYSVTDTFRYCGLEISTAVYCEDADNEEQNEYFDTDDFPKFLKNHECEEVRI